jgi:hypothetical protein
MLLKSSDVKCISLANAADYPILSCLVNQSRYQGTNLSLYQNWTLIVNRTTTLTKIWLGRTEKHLDYRGYHYAQFRGTIVVLSAIVLSVFMLNAIMLSVFMLSIIILSVIILTVIMLSVYMQSAIMLRFIIRKVIIVNVPMYMNKNDFNSKLYHIILKWV